MCPLFESIAIENGIPQHIKWHNLRLNKSRKILFHSKKPINLEEVIVPEYARKNVWKCRVVYMDEIISVNFEPYAKKEIKTFKIMESKFAYEHKYNNRDDINNLMKQKGEADDVIIIRNGLVTDSSIANILLNDGNKWVTPDTPLLEGTMRAQLLDQNIIISQPIHRYRLLSYKKIMLVNAFMAFDESRAIELPKAIIS